MHTFIGLALPSPEEKCEWSKPQLHNLSAMLQLNRNMCQLLELTITMDGHRLFLAPTTISTPFWWTLIAYIIAPACDRLHHQGGKSASQAPPPRESSRTIHRPFRDGSGGIRTSSFSQIHTHTHLKVLCCNRSFGTLSYCLGLALRLCVPVLLFLLRPYQRTPCPGTHLPYLAWRHHKSLDRPVMERMLAFREYTQLPVPKLKNHQSTGC